MRVELQQRGEAASADPQVPEAPVIAETPAVVPAVAEAMAGRQEASTFAEAASETIATVADTFAYAPETPTGEAASVAGDIAHAQAGRGSG